MPARRVVPDRVWARELVCDVLPALLLTRLVFVALTLLIPMWRTATGLGRFTLYRATGTAFDEWNRWDTRWYDDLARLGYNLHGPNDYKNVAFFPLYPLLVRTLHEVIVTAEQALLGVVPPDRFHALFLIAGLIVANLCSVAALAFLYGLVRLDYGRPAARRATTLLLLSPMSFFLFAAYSEGTFLLCTAAFFYAVRLERWWQAGLWGLLAAATRPPGALLLLPFLMAWAQAHPVAAGSLAARLRLAWRALVAHARVRVQVQQPRRVLVGAPLDFHPSPSQDRTPRRRADDVCPGQLPRRFVAWRPHDWPDDEARRALRHVLPAVVIPLGLVFFMAFLYQVFGDPLWFSRAQQAWWRTFAPPWVTLYFSIVWPFGDLLRGALTYWDTYALHDLGYAIMGMGLTWPAWRRLPRVQGVYLWLFWLVVLSAPAMLTKAPMSEPHHDVLMSLPRMLLTMFPLFTYLALRRRLYPWLSVLFALALVLYTGAYLTGAWIS
jgi:Mannosyltransferase (PIG-V)